MEVQVNLLDSAKASIFIPLTHISAKRLNSNSSGKSQIKDGEVWHDKGNYYEDNNDMYDEGYYYEDKGYYYRNERYERKVLPITSSIIFPVYA